VENEREDTLRDNTQMETSDEIENLTRDRLWRDSDPTTSGVHKKTGLYERQPNASRYQTTKDTPEKDDDPPLPPPQMSPKRLKKLKTDRDISNTRDRSRSRNRHKLQ
jgi:hypothetical protein